MQSKIRLLLNTADRNTNILFDQETGVRFTSQKPYAEVSKVSKGMERSIAAGKLIDIDEVTGISVNSDVKAIHDYLLKLSGIARLNSIETIDEEVRDEEIIDEQLQEETQEPAQEEQEPAQEPAKEEPPAQKQRKNNKKKDSEKE